MIFEEAVDIVVNIKEKGYVNDPDDPGGETKYGISKRSYPEENIKELTIERAKEIYRRDFWDRCSCDQLPGWINYHVFDAAVNSGPDTAIGWLQRAVGAKPDKIMGAKTIACTRRADPATAIARLSAIRLKEITKAKNWKKHGAGWVNRVCDNILENLA